MISLKYYKNTKKIQKITTILKKMNKTIYKISIKIKIKKINAN